MFRLYRSAIRSPCLAGVTSSAVNYRRELGNSHGTRIQRGVLTIFVPNSIFPLIDVLSLSAIIIHKFGTHIRVGDGLPPRTGSPAPVDRRQWTPARSQEVYQHPGSLSRRRRISGRRAAGMGAGSQSRQSCAQPHPSSLSPPPPELFLARWGGRCPQDGGGDVRQWGGAT